MELVYPGNYFKNYVLHPIQTIQNNKKVVEKARSLYPEGSLVMSKLSSCYGIVIGYSLYYGQAVLKCIKPLKSGKKQRCNILLHNVKRASTNIKKLITRHCLLI